jgi:hypothetical protein
MRCTLPVYRKKAAHITKCLVMHALQGAPRHCVSRPDACSVMKLTFDDCVGKEKET